MGAYVLPLGLSAAVEAVLWYDVAAQEISRMPFKPTGVLGFGDLVTDTAPDCVLMYNPDFLEQICPHYHLLSGGLQYRPHRAQHTTETHT